MNPEQENILEYVKHHRHTPLIFMKTNYTPANLEPILENLDNLDDMVLNCINLARQFTSNNINSKKVETWAGRWRSVLDIWRHVIYFKSDVTIFQVMESIYRLRENFSSHYCTTIRRRVFNVFSNNVWPIDGDSYDEFNLPFRVWENIGSEE